MGRRCRCTGRDMQITPSVNSLCLAVSLFHVGHNRYAWNEAPTDVLERSVWADTDIAACLLVSLARFVPTRALEAVHTAGDAVW